MEENNRYMLDLIDGAHGRTVKWMGRIIVALIVAWLVTIGAFLWYLSLYDYISEETTTEYTQDSNGLNIIAEGNGVNVNGTKVQTNDADQSAEGENNGQPPQNDG